MPRSLIVKICLLASGSKGNAIYVEHDGFRLLVDVGLTTRQLIKRLGQISVTLEQIDAIIITHEHSDHIRGLEGLASDQIPVYLNEGTYQNLKLKRRKQPLPIKLIKTGNIFRLGDVFDVEPVATPHDAADPISLILRTDHQKVAIATDLGYVTRRVGTRMIGANVIILESNHDEKMVIQSRYPWSVKQRILSKNGHLSNIAFNDALSKLIHCDLESVFLAHLSEENNTPDLARQLAVATIQQSEHPNIPIYVGHQHTISPMITI